MMNGEVVSHSVTVFSCSRSGVHNEKMSFRLTQEGTSSPVCSLLNEAPTQAQSRAADPTETESSFSRRSPCWSAEHLTPPLLHRAQVCLRPPPELPVSLCNGFSHSLLHANNNNGSALYSRQRRGARAKVAGKRATRGMVKGANSQNRKVTDFFPIRRSSRKSKTELKCEEKKLIDDLITNGIEEGMEVQHVEGKGRAVFATRCFQKGDYVVEYHGDLLQITDAKKREAEYAQNPATGCYMYYFQYLCKTYCVDATKETGRMGRLINHSKTGNCQTKLHDINSVPHLILVASRDIDKGEELLYDYGDRSKASIAAHPWLKY
ncbi:N-lysine methyltransferase KMT5A-A isoform X2 [Nematolebias whitei]|uniref:N-lysine methyltransferase KMT5A-A isoform X2 n=1 Tax=Nematolebias whitei TaxID=451745 RepID=UPI0018987AE1|nr:N-lysine methyltransferase KMT5A-A isoform X2 [Nematolebias whitei]